MIPFGYQARKRLTTALAQNLITKEQFTEWDAAREKKNQNSGQAKEEARAKEEALRTQLFAIVNGNTPAAGVARSVRIEVGVEDIQNQLETDRETINKFERVNSGAALPDRLPDQTARDRLAIVYGEIRRLQSEGKNLRPEVAAELRAQRPVAAAKGRGRGRGSASKPTAGGKDSSAGQTKLADHFGKSPPTPSTDVPSPTPTSTDVPSPAIAGATDTCTDTDGGPFVLTVRRHHGKSLHIECEADDSCLDVRCNAARKIQCDHWEIKLANGPFTLSDDTPASAYKGQTLWVKKA